MNGLGWLLPGRKRGSRFSLDIQALADSAARQSELSGFEPRRAALWQALCSGAGDVVRQLIVKKEDRRLDWGVARHRGRVDDYRLLTIYWWMLLYHVVLYRNRGIEGYDPRDDLPSLREAAQVFLERELDRIPTAQPPSPWVDRWDRQFTLESAMGIYDRVHALLGLPVDMNKRVNRVSFFTTATEHAYDRMVERLTDG